MKKLSNSLARRSTLGTISRSTRGGKFGTFEAGGLYAPAIQL